MKQLHFGCHDTRKNLPEALSSKTGEEDFQKAFELTWFQEFSGETHASGREFGLDGFGRADLVVASWQLGQSELTLTAVEAKLKDWRKGLMQAARYRYYAHTALLVLPPPATKLALKVITTFQELHLGLWEYDLIKNEITKHYTPNPRKPLSLKGHTKAVRIIQEQIQKP